MRYQSKYKHQVVQFEIFIDQGKKTMLTINRFIAEALYENFGDAHEWLQDKYDSLNKHNKETGQIISRRALGDWVRREAYKAVT